MSLPTALCLFCQLATAAAGPAAYAEKPAAPLLQPPYAPPPPDTRLPSVAPPPNTGAPLFSCNDCGRRKWVSDVNELKKAAARCGYDFLSVRFTQDFAADSLRGRLTVFARTDVNDSLIVDSAYTACELPGSAEEIVTIYHHPRPDTPNLTLPGAHAFKVDRNDRIDNVVRIAATFRSACRVKTGDTASRGSWRFLLHDHAFLVEKGRILSAPAPRISDTRLCGDIAYRLEFWGASPLQAAPIFSARSTGPKILRFDVNDSSSICRIRLECLSDNGLLECRIVGGVAYDTINLLGAKHRSFTTSVNVRDDDSLLSITVTDILGNRTSASQPIFGERRRYRAERNLERTIELLTHERARGNPLRYGAYLLSKLSGEPSLLSSDQAPAGSTAPMNSPRFGLSLNPVSPLLRKLFRNKSETYLAAIGDPKPLKPLDALTFPRSGMVYGGLFTNTAGAYTTSLFSDNVVMNGTRIAALSNPTLRSTANNGNNCTFSIHAPFIDGRYPASWSIDTSGTPGASAVSTLLLCAKAECNGPQVTLYDIPYVLPKPNNNVAFTMYHATTIPGADTLTVTWCIRYADRTSELVFLRFQTGPANTIEALNNDTRTVETTPYSLLNVAGERCFILPVRMQGPKRIFRVDAFVHSLSRNEIVGWGSASCRG